MKCWTVISSEELNTLKSTHTLLCDHTKKNVMANDFFMFKIAYDFMANHLEQFSPKPKNVIYPRWIYYKFNNINSIHHVNKCVFCAKPTNSQFLLELNLNPKDVLLSDLDMWTNVLNGFYIAESEQEADSFYNDSVPPQSIFDPAYISSLNDYQRAIIQDKQKQIIQSWEKIFNLNSNNPYYCFKNKTIQGVTWKINYEQVLKISRLHITNKEIMDWKKS